MIDQNIDPSTDPGRIDDEDMSEDQLIYKENILDHYKHPRNKHELSPAQRHEEKNPLCGDVITVYLRTDGIAIHDISFEGKGCAISQASMSMLTERLKGVPVSEARALSKDDVLEMLGIPIGVVRMKCAMLGLRTTQAVIDKVRS
jgi:nitrogen fixation protein NifU and related proteins